MRDNDNDELLLGLLVLLRSVEFWYGEMRRFDAYVSKQQAEVLHVSPASVSRVAIAENFGKAIARMTQYEGQSLRSAAMDAAKAIVHRDGTSTEGSKFASNYLILRDLVNVLSERRRGIDPKDKFVSTGIDNEELSRMVTRYRELSISWESEFHRLLEAYGLDPWEDLQFPRREE